MMCFRNPIKTSGVLNETTCQGHPCRFSVLPETLPSLGSHDSSLSCFSPVLTFSALSPLQAHYCPLGFGMLESLKEHLSFWLVNAQSSFKAYPKCHSLGEVFPGLLDQLNPPYMDKCFCLPLNSYLEVLISNVMVFGDAASER